MGGGHAVAGKQLLQRFRIAVGIRRCHHQLCASDQWPEELPHRDIKAARRFLQHYIITAERITILHPQQPVDDCLMTDQHAFWPTGRTRGIDEVSAIMRTRSLCQHAINRG